MKMDSEARRIYELKKDNIQQGEDKDLVRQVGDGKDIMSHLRECNCLYPPRGSFIDNFLLSSSCKYGCA